MLVSGIIILTIGIISQISTDSYMKLRREAELYNEIYSGFDLVERSVRGANQVAVNGNTLSVYSPEINYSPENVHKPEYNFTFEIQGNAFGYTNELTGMYHKILDGVDGLSFAVSNISDTLFTVDIAGEKDDIPFNLSANVTRRN